MKFNFLYISSDEKKIVRIFLLPFWCAIFREKKCRSPVLFQLIDFSFSFGLITVRSMRHNQRRQQYQSAIFFRWTSFIVLK